MIAGYATDIRLIDSGDYRFDNRVFPDISTTVCTKEPRVAGLLRHMTKVLLGFDPGGEDAFGWSVVEDGDLPLKLRGRGYADNAEQALEKARGICSPEDQILAAGIDAPLHWIASGDKKVDQLVRDSLRKCGCPEKYLGGTVQHVNSLKGACLVQGVAMGIQLRMDYAELRITEAHPKALLWLLKEVPQGGIPKGVYLSNLTKYFRGNLDNAHEHERDAALGALSAWAMLHTWRQPTQWIDLMKPLEHGAILPLKHPVEYWMPQYP